MNIRHIALLLCVLGVCVSCSRRTRYTIEGSSQVLLLTNLHPDEARGGLLYSVNYIRDGLIPVCTPVNMDVITDRELRFTVPATGRQHRYLFHAGSMRGETVEQHVAKYFGTSCPDVRSLPAIDQQGIQEGRLYYGMSKQGVIVAIGYPPVHRTPSLDGDTWTYWHTRMGTFRVHFVNGVVAQVEGPPAVQPPNAPTPYGQPVPVQPASPFQ